MASMFLKKNAYLLRTLLMLYGQSSYLEKSDLNYYYSSFIYLKKLI